MKNYSICVTTRVFWVGFSAIAIVGCGGIDQHKVADQIKQDITTNGGTSVKTVTCPGNIKPEAGKSFDCVGEMDNGYTFTIAVQQQDDKGNLTWDVPHAKGLINVPKLESNIQETLTTEIGTQPAIACGGIYKAVSPGQGFDCQLTYTTMKPAPKPVKPAQGKTAKPAQAAKPTPVTRTEKVTVTTDSSGNVSWQRVLPKLATKPPATQAAPTTVSTQ
jgi:hypothetical protein